MLAFVALAFGVDLSGSIAITITCLGSLLFGLPHGALDIELLQRSAERSLAATFTLVALYLGLAALTFSLWHEQPVLSLALFLGVSVLHFAEDWVGCDSPFLALGMALGLLAAPVLFHRSTIIGLFVTLTNDPSAALVADVLLILAPVALLVAIGCVIELGRLGHFEPACNAGLTLLVMVALPPLIGFAIMFCLIHSPKHLSDNVKAVLAQKMRPRSLTKTVVIIGAVTAAAVGIAVLIFHAQLHPSPNERMIAASFMTLSVLTVPHILVPQIVGAWLNWARISPR